MIFSQLKKSARLALLILFALGPGSVFAQDQSADISAIRREMQELRDELHRTISEKQKKIDDLERQVQVLQSQPAAAKQPAAAASGESALDRALSGLEQYQQKTGKGDLVSRQIGGATVRLMDISFDVLAVGGSSTERDASIEVLQGGAHDPKRRGFTLQQAELGLQGAVDPYMTSEAFIVFTEEGVELEEAFFKTTSLPWDLQLKGGFFLTEFGIINQTHPHAWEWIDQPIVNTRFFGGDGTRASGVRLSWLIPTPWFSELYVGMQNANSETEVSFLGAREGFETTIGGRPVVDHNISSLGDFLYSARWENSFDLSNDVTTKFGFSGVFGPNNSGPDGYTRIYGADLKVKWRPASNERGWPYLLWQTEIMARDYKADGSLVGDGADVIALPGETLHDWGLYTQLLYGFHPGWAAGVRYEYATGSEPSVFDFTGRNEDPFRDDRHRVSPLLAWYLTEFSRFRLQYNYDHAVHLKDDAHSVWLGAEFLIGSHPTHKY
jgi:hypothetical protein